MSAAVRRLLSGQYSVVGAAVSIARSRARASNPHFVVRAKRSRFFLKQVREPDALYEKDGLVRLTAVSAAVAELGRAGLPVERLVPADSGAPLVVDGGSAFRLYRFIEGRPWDGGVRDLRAAARAIGRLHAHGRKALSPASARRVAALQTPYPLERTAPRMKELASHLLEPGLLREALALTRPLLAHPVRPVLAHLDFHPGNALFTAGKAVIIDLDNMQFADHRKCAALSVLRFSRPGAAGLRRGVEYWASAYERTSGLRLDESLYRWMILVELEKILRIAARVRDTGAYRGFLKNIASRHLPNLRLLMTLA